jgi:hypothetical protein
VIGGQIAGSWRTISTPPGIRLQVEAARRLTPGERRGVARATARYRRFLGIPLSLSVT